MTKSPVSFILVFVQFGCLVLLGLTGPVITRLFYALAVEIISIILGAWAILVMQSSKLNVFPDVRNGAKLVAEGPYSLIRHPMYLSVILFALSLLLENFSFFRLGVFIVLISDLLYKVHYEEKLLLGEFELYREYCRNTRKLIPFIY